MEDHTYQAEIGRQRRKINEAYSWHFLAKRVADWTNETFFVIMDKPAVEVFAIVLLMQAEINLNKTKSQ